MAFINSILSIFTQKRLAQIDFFKANPIKVQRDTLQELLTLAANTEYGRKYHFNTILTAEQYRERLPIVHYEDIRDLSCGLWKGRIICFGPKRSNGSPNRRGLPMPKVSSSR